MSGNKTFIDTNMLVYLYSENIDDYDKRLRVHEEMKQCNCHISTQVLNEFSNICIKKLKIATHKIQYLINEICSYCDLVYIDEGTINQALEIHSKYGFSYYDSLILASALECKCDYLFSEDLSDGQVIDGALTIRNIFA